jgi:hypothetical protein
MTEEVPEQPPALYDADPEVVRVADLRALIEEWRHSLYTNRTENNIRASCADELEALIEDE